MTACHFNTEELRAPENGTGGAHDQRRFNARVLLRGQVVLSQHECGIGAPDQH